jgi:hypothetical protein
MKLNRISKYIAVPFNVSITVLMLLFAVHFLQFIVSMTWGTLRYEDTLKELGRMEDPNSRISRSHKNFLPDGTVHLVDGDRYSRAGDSNIIEERIYDVNDNLIWQGRSKDRPYEYLSWAEYPINGFDDRYMKQIRRITPEVFRTLEIPVNSESKNEQVWCYDPELDLFVGYRIKGGRIGYIGSGGFADSKSAVKPFGRFKRCTAWVPEDSFSPALFWQTNLGIYEINFEEQRVEVIFESMESEIGLVRLNKWGFSGSGERGLSKIKYRPIVHCFTEDGKGHLILKNPEQKLTISVPEDWCSDVAEFTATENSIFMKYWGRELMPPKVSYYDSPSAWDEYRREYPSKPRKERVEFYRVDDKGGFDLVNRFDWIMPASPVTDMRHPWEIVKDYLTRLSPPVYDLAWYLFKDEMLRLAHRYGSGMTAAYTLLICEFRPRYSSLNCILSAAMMVFAFWHGWSRRTSWGKLFFWLVLVGAFNLAGLLGYLALNHTAVIKCPACGRRRGLERVDCVRCGAQLPVPERRKLDLIFDI